MTSLPQVSVPCSIKVTALKLRSLTSPCSQLVSSLSFLVSCLVNLNTTQNLSTQSPCALKPEISVVGTTIRNCVPYNHAQNGGAERPIRTLKESGTTNLTQSKLNIAFLFDSVRHFAYTRQVLPGVDGISIHEKYYGTPPHPCRLVTFGCAADAVIPLKLRLSHGPRSEEGIILGYNNSTPIKWILLFETK